MGIRAVDPPVCHFTLGDGFDAGDHQRVKQRTGAGGVAETVVSSLSNMLRKFTTRPKAKANASGSGRMQAPTFSGATDLGPSKNFDHVENASASGAASSSSGTGAASSSSGILPPASDSVFDGLSNLDMAALKNSSGSDGFQMSLWFSSK